MPQSELALHSINITHDIWYLMEDHIHSTTTDYGQLKEFVTETFPEKVNVSRASSVNGTNDSNLNVPWTDGAETPLTTSGVAQ